MPHPAGTDLLGAAGGRCASCVLRPSRIEAVRAAVQYDRVARRLMLRAKFGGRVEILRHFGQQLAVVASQAGFGERCSLAIAVPSHPWVYVRRGFNPALEIARPVARKLGARLGRGILSRRWSAAAATKRLSAAARWHALLGAFRATRSLRGERVLLIDDVLTTGATVEGCAAALLSAGAKSVHVLAWARTPLRR